MTANSEMLGDLLIIAGKRLKNGKCSLTQEQSDAIFEQLGDALDVQLSKESACAELGISRSTFDSRVAAGELPEGKHIRGFKEKRWSRRELKPLYK